MRVKARHDHVSAYGIKIIFFIPAIFIGADHDVARVYIRLGELRRDQIAKTCIKPEVDNFISCLLLKHIFIYPISRAAPAEDYYLRVVRFNKFVVSDLNFTLICVVKNILRPDSNCDKKSRHYRRGKEQYRRGIADEAEHIMFWIRF